MQCGLCGVMWTQAGHPLRCQRVRARKRERANNGIRDALQGAIAAVPAVETPEPESETSESWSAASREGGQRSAAECMTTQPAEGEAPRWFSYSEVGRGWQHESRAVDGGDMDNDGGDIARWGMLAVAHRSLIHI